MAGFSIIVTKQSPAAIFAHEAYEQVKEIISVLQNSWKKWLFND